MQPQAVSLINPPNMIYNSNFLSFYLKPVVVSLTSPSFIHPYLNSQFHHVNSFWSFPQVLPYDLFTSWLFFPSLSVSSPEVWVLSSFLALDLGGGGGRFLDFNRDFFFFFFFLGLHTRHIEVPRLGIKLELQLLGYATAIAMQDPSRDWDLHQAHSKIGSLTRWARPGMESASSWILVRLVTAEPQQELPKARI